MENIDILVVRIEKVIGRLKMLVEENRMLKLELEYLKKEYTNSKRQMSGCIVLKKNTEDAIVKIEKIIKKIDMTKI
ncbi:MAG: hypothetical protein LBC05_01540 [Endomicrobium sp.]|jgi:regulator of replication initiation timing|nr:hypothetical protein [Endomicrobium sp.]